MTEQIPERAQATAIQRLDRAATARAKAQQQERDATAQLKREVQAALKAGVSTRRIAQVAGISLDTIGKWKPTDTQ